mmetsp:Transcript_15803/g.42672  ORF Transcript_15803/g.42672 Transcript_15803/m.42672 type:complete len:218 (-) Transcript_15803:14-667(-)
MAQKFWFNLIWSYQSSGTHKTLTPLKKKLFQEQEEPISGCVVELGPGFGENMELYVDPSKISNLYLLEPNTHMHTRLTEAAMKTGLPSSSIHVLAQDACKIPLSDKSVDSVLCTLVLCSVSDQKAVISEVTRILRPGGRFFWIEHVAAPGGSTGSWIQRGLMACGAWKYFGDGCELCRHTGQTLRSSPGWSSFTLDTSNVLLSFVPLEYGVATRAPH